MLTTSDLLSSSIVHNYCFGNSPNILGNLQLASIRRTNVAVVLSSVKIMLHFSWLRSHTQMLPPSIGSQMTPPGDRNKNKNHKNTHTQNNHKQTTKPTPKKTPSIFT